IRIMPVIVLMALTLVAGAEIGPASDAAVMLDDYSPCGITSLFLVCKIRQVDVEWNALKELVGPAEVDQTHSFEDISRAAAALGMHPVGLQVSRASLNGLPMPAIVQVH